MPKAVEDETHDRVEEEIERENVLGRSRLPPYQKREDGEQRQLGGGFDELRRKNAALRIGLGEYRLQPAPWDEKIRSGSENAVSVRFSIASPAKETADARETAVQRQQQSQKCER